MSNTSIINERAFEDLIEQHLLEHGGYERGSKQEWSRELALDRANLLGFIKGTQPEAWSRLSEIHKDEVTNRFLARLHKELDNRGMLDVLRHGLIDYGVRFHLAYFAPATNLNTETQRLYEANRLTVLRQLRWSQKNERDSIDLVLCLNGLPVGTIELKNQFTQQTASDARRQFIEDRDPRELIFSFKKRVLVHFAVDADEVWMTTALNGRETRFLPFNKGYQNGAGNPPNENGHRTAYLWEEVLKRDSWMDILGNFIHLQQDEVRYSEYKVRKESLIFPRYHQLDVVRHLTRQVRLEAGGHNYLIQHSAGSGKSNSIAWLAHRLSNLHDNEDHPVFDSVIVISDRRVLDRQLQDSIYQFEHKQGVVIKIERDSAQLAEALRAGVKIIITTLQKFPFVLGKIDELPTRKYAVIVDEAHSSQTGASADAMKKVLSSSGPSRDNTSVPAAAEERTYEDLIVESMQARKASQLNLSFFAFTATPKAKTLEAFGTLGEDGTPRACHLYSMRQAIEEKFILDVLKNYTTYKTFFKLSKSIQNDPRLDKKQAKRAIARFISFHPHNLAQKVEVIVEHFRQVVMSKIGGRAKGMVVTSSRLHAVRYKLEVDKYLQEKGYSTIKTLVAFSGTVTDDYAIAYTEAEMNGFGERELPDRFGGDDYRLLLVAEKYQTGFDQPLLHTMYVDKKLSGVRAVQTLSRLNRIYPGKEDTFILDFANEAREIQEAFQPFYQGTTTEEDTDPNQLYDIKLRLDAFGVTRVDEVENFARAFFRPHNTQLTRNHAMLNALIDPAVGRFKEKVDGEQDEFRHLLTGFIRLYGFLSQVMPFTDAELEKFYAYSRLLITKLQASGRIARIRMNDEIALEYYRLQKMSEGSIELERRDESGLRVPTDIGTGQNVTEEEALSRIIQVLNERFGTEFTNADRLFFEQVEEDIVNDETLAQQGRSNSIDNFRYPFNDVFIDKVIARMEQNQEITDKIINEELFANVVREVMLARVYKRINDKR